MKPSGAQDPNAIPGDVKRLGASRRSLNYSLPAPSADQTVNVLLAISPGPVQQLLEGELVRRGYRPILVNRADQLLGLLQMYPSRLLILDRLPDVANPYVFCKECLALHPSLNILLLVDRLTNPRDARRLMALRFGALDMVSSEVSSLGRLVERIEVLVQPPHAASESPNQRVRQRSEEAQGPAQLPSGNAPRSWLNSLVAALPWPMRQRQSDPADSPGEDTLKLGARLVSQRLISEDQLAYALQEQKILGLRLGEVCIYLGWLSYADLLLVLEQPQHLLGQILVASGYLSFAQLRLALQEQQETQQHLATIIHSHHWVSREVLKQALQEQQRLQGAASSSVEDGFGPRLLPASTGRPQRSDRASPAADPEQAKIDQIARQASILCGLERLSEARQLLQEGLAQYPQHPGLLLGYGVVLNRQGELAKAAQVLETLSQVQPESSAALTLLGTIYVALSDKPRARQVYARAYVLLSKQKRPVEARRVREALDKLEP